MTSDDPLAAVLAQVRTAARERTALQILGGGSKNFYGNVIGGEPLEVSGLLGIVAYEPTELVITARAGEPLAGVEARLAEHGQMLAFEPPHFNEHATIGGMVACGLSGPRRAAVGGVRDFVLGARLIDGQARLLKFGGQVIKNVAGYDVSRLLTGSLGTLGVITEVSLKVLPRPFAARTLQFQATENEAITQMNQWAGQALPITATVFHGGDLSVRLEGTEAAVNAAVKKLGGEQIAPAENFWRGIRDQCAVFFNSSETLWRLSVPSTTPPLALAGEILYEWNGALRWLKTDALATEIRTTVSAVGGHATRFRGSDSNVPVFHPLAGELLHLHQRIKKVFDPHGIFNINKLYADF